MKLKFIIKQASLDFTYYNINNLVTKNIQFIDELDFNVYSIAFNEQVLKADFISETDR